ncbi:MAG: DUF4160 domain-containing protein [Roseburia inulinivorans]|nr:DUF4160 domain-containing protein [Lachnospiraceae bacterium]
MPQIFRIVPYSIYFWSNESDPLEPIHVHISEGRATSNATKIWITSTGKTVIKVLGENPGACSWDENMIEEIIRSGKKIMNSGIRTV